MEYYSAIKKNDMMPFAATWMELETLILSEVSQKERKRQTPNDITYIWNLIHGTKEPFHRKENHGFGEQICGCQEEEEKVGWIGSLRLMDVNYYLWNGLAMRSCCVALGTLSSHSL